MSSSRMVRRGMTLIELLIAMTLFTLIAGAALGFVVNQGRGFRTLADRSTDVQGGRVGRDLLRTELRNAGTNVTDVQPTIVLANDSAFAFNADLTTNLSDAMRRTGAVYVDPYAPAGAISAIRTTNAIAIPGSRPAFTYPLEDYSQVTGVFINGDAELLTYWFAPDSEAGPDRYALWRRVNDTPAELVATDLRRVPGRPFFRYHYDPSRFGATDPDLDTVPRSWLPLTKTVAQRGVGADTGTAITRRIDALRAVEVTYEATPPRGGVREVVRYMVPLPNVANARQSRACGRVPITPPAPTVLWRSDSQFVQITISKAIDDGSGEKDAIRYVLWRRLEGATSWGEPFQSMAATQAATYLIRDAGMPSRPGSYRYALAVQDCTPNLSSMVTSTVVSVP